MQHKTALEFATVTQNGVVQKIGRSSILQPKINFQGDSVKWLKDKLKKQSN